MNELRLNLIKIGEYSLGVGGKGIAKGLLSGGGFCYALKKRHPGEMVLAVVVPPVYVGYQLVKSVNDLEYSIEKDFKEFLNENREDIVVKINRSD